MLFYFTTVLSSIQQKTLAFVVVVEVYPDIWEKDTRLF